MKECIAGCYSPSGSPLQKTFLKKIRFIDIFYSVLVFSQRGCDSLNSCGAAVEFLDQCQQKFSVHFIKASFINIERDKRLLCYGKVYSAEWVRGQLVNAGLVSTELVPLESDTAVLVAARNPEKLAELRVGPLQQLAGKIQSLGFDAVQPIEVDSIQVPEWVGLKCQFGCDSFGGSQCPPNCIKPEKTRAMLADYSKCLLLQGAPPTRDFQAMVLRAERAAFTAGYYKAFSLWAGPCSICVECSGAGCCINPKNARPSMEASGIDVFETVRRAGFALETLPEKDDYVKYFAILLLE